MRLSRGLALMLIVAGTLFGATAPWLSVSHGPPKSSFEAVRRFDSALARGQTRDASQLGLKALALAQADTRWSPGDLARLSYRTATTLHAAGRNTLALQLARSTTETLASVPAAGQDLVIGSSTLRGDLALAAGNKLEATCTYGLLLERVGPDRVARPEARLRPDPALAPLTTHLSALGGAFQHSGESGKEAGSWPATSCNLLANFYTARRDFAAAASVSDLVLERADADPSLGPEMRAALHQNAAHIAEMNGDLKGARAHLQRAVDILPATGNKVARAVALEALANFLSNWSDSKSAMPLLDQSIALREETDGSTNGSLVSPLIALGYAQLDTGTPAKAELAFNRALSISQSDHSRNPSAALEAMLALTELYEGQDRGADAQAMRAKSSALQSAGVTLRPSDVENVPIEQPSSRARLAVFSISYLANPHSIAAGAPTSGAVDVALGAPSDASWTKSFGSSSFTPASENTSHPFVYAPKATTTPVTPTIVFVPGQGTSFDDNAARLARLQTQLGPKQELLLINWPGASSPDGLRDPVADAQARSALNTLLASFGKDSSPITFIAEGRGAEILREQMSRADVATRSRIAGRLAHLILIAPETDETALAAYTETTRRGGAQVTVYAARTARPLLIASDVYGAKPVGLDPERIAAMRTAETVEIGIGSDQLDFNALFSDALAADIATVVTTGASADKRCGLTHMSGDAPVYVLTGCRPSKSY